MLLTAGCGGTASPVPAAPLLPQPPEAAAAWGVPANIKEEGTGNSVRVVKGLSLGAESALELAAGGGGSLEYSQTAAASADTQGRYRLQFLSTQGTGRIKIAALDPGGRPIATVGWVFTGPMPAAEDRTKWLDVRYQANYAGGWITFDDNIAQLLAAQFPQSSFPAAGYRLSVEAGQGQHVLVTSLQLQDNPSRAVRITPRSRTATARCGDVLAVSAEIENLTGRALQNLAVSLIEPYGFGVAAEGNITQTVDLAPGEKRLLTWQTKARRADAVNFGQPWVLGFAVNGEATPEATRVSVSDTRPGTVFYVMTEDLEAIDSAGYGSAWGNRDSWLQPEELTVQMVHKAEALDRIAERHGAYWTHYIAWPLVKASDWAAGQSTTGKWAEAAAQIRRSVRQESARGHEYAIHLHSDYDPYLPDNVLSYNPANDGIWANHLRHGWAHSLPAEGGFGDYASRNGFLYHYQRLIDEATVTSPLGEILTARAGSFDFGNGDDSERISIQAFRQVGLRGGSDAEGNRGGITAGDYGREIYFTKPQDINAAATDPTQIGIVEFCPTPRNFIAYDHDSAEAMNQKADAGMAAFTADGRIKPGIHAIVGFTHAMFMLGEGDWRSTEGGQFAVLDRHLAYLKERYSDKELLRFATATELVKAYLDYYAPNPVAVYGPRRSSGWWGVSEYPIQMLGRDIPADAGHPHQVTVKYPLYLRDEAYRIVVLKNGAPVFSTWGLPTPANDILFTYDDSEAQYSLKIYHSPYLAAPLAMLRNAKAKLAGWIH